MGCASSSPLLESGKNFIETTKESASEIVTKGGETIEGVGETVKEKVTHEMDHIQHAMKTALTTTGNSILGTAEETSNAISDDAKEVMNNVEESEDYLMSKMSDSATEAVSEAETVLASEAENVKDILPSTTGVLDQLDSARTEAENKVGEVATTVSDTLQIEDMDEHFDMLGDSVSASNDKVEEILKKLPTPATSPVKKTIVE